MTTTIVHILHEGHALCGFSLEVPAKWPKDHKWVSLEGRSRAPALPKGSGFCSECGNVALSLKSITNEKKL